MDAISKITFSIGGFFGGYRNYVVELSDGLKAYTKLWEDEETTSHAFCRLFRNGNNFIDDVYAFEESNKDMELTRYGDILNDNGLEWDSRIYGI